MGRLHQQRADGGKQPQKADLEHAQQNGVALVGEFGRQDDGDRVQAGLHQTQALAQSEPGQAVFQRQESHACQRYRRAQQRPAIRGLPVQHRLKQRHDDNGGVGQERHGGGGGHGQSKHLAGHHGEERSA